ncbi:MAG: alpha/beta hydrolase fold domain-containing protein, partial [Gammaproteobacteria bacterium]
MLRYRTVPSGEDAVAEMVSKSPEQASADMQRIAPLAGADGLAAMRLVRARADDFGADPARVGFLGFSAGGAVTMTVALGYDEATRPAFVAPIYAGAGRWNDQAVPDDAPPMFLVAASDDQLGLARDSVA